MITFIFAITILIGGYFLYGKLAEKVFRPYDRPTPAVEHPDGVDYVPMKTWRVFLIQLLNIAGTGPIFGALMGAVFGPVVFLWIVFGSILGGAIHDYMSGMISVRLNGASISEIVGKYLGGAAKQVMRVFSVILLVLVGALAIIGVVVCPVSSGDTAFRSARLTIADWFKIDQSKIGKRLLITLPLLAVGALLTQLNFDIIWRYFSWSNQTLAMITLWAAAVYLIMNAKKIWYSAICAVPAAFMSGVSCTYILMAEEGFRVSQVVAYPIGFAFAIICTALFLFKANSQYKLRRKEM